MMNVDLTQAIVWDAREDLECLERDSPGPRRGWPTASVVARRSVSIASFPSRESAERILTGDWTGVSGDPGWSRAEYGTIDIIDALHRYHAKHGKFPYFALAADATVVELYTRIDPDLGLDFIGNLMTIEEEAVGPLDVGGFYPMWRSIYAAAATASMRGRAQSLRRRFPGCWSASFATTTTTTATGIRCSHPTCWRPGSQNG